MNVILGAHNIRTLEGTQQHISVLRPVPHPGYSPQSHSNDIMLLQVPTLWFFSWAAHSQPGGFQSTGIREGGSQADPQCVGGLPVSWDQGGGSRADSQGGGGHGESIE